LLLLADGCEDGGPAAGEDAAGGACEGGDAGGGDRVCPEVYVALVQCLSMGAARRESCVARALAEAGPESCRLAEAVLRCEETTCSESRGAGLQKCFLEDCEAMGPCLDDARRVRNPCDGAEPNEQGIGTPCTEKAECAALDLPAFNCPWSIPAEEEREEANLPRWCNHLCELDEDCGERAFCWLRRGWDDSFIGSCALWACVPE